MSVLPLRGGRVVERFDHGQSEDSRSAPKCAQLFLVTDATDCIRSEFANTGSVKYIAKLLHAMSRAAYFITAVVLGVVAVFWWFTKWLLTVSYAMEKDSAPGGADVSGVLVVWGIIFIGILICLLWCLARAFSPVRRDSASLPTQASQPQQSPSLATPDEKLAHLVKKP